MPKIQHQGFETDIKYVLDYYIEPKEYQDWTQKIKDQYYKSIEVPGFRKGKAPESMVLKQVNPQALAQSVIQETLDKFGNEGITIMQTELKNLNRIPLVQTYSMNPEKTKEVDGGYLLSLFVEVLPDVDLEKAANISYEKATEKDLKERMNLADYIKKEKNGYIANHTKYESTDEKADDMYQVVVDMSGTVGGNPEPKLEAKEMLATIGSGTFLPDFEKGIRGLKKDETRSFDVEFPINYFDNELAGKKAVFTVVTKEVKKPISLSFEDVVKDQNPEDHHGHNHPSFTTEKEFDAYVTDFYNQDTERMIREINQQRIIKAAVEQVPAFSLPDDKIDAETKRILGVLEEDAIRTKKSVVEVFSLTDLPGHDAVLKSDDDVRAKIHDYVSKEFKLASIWNVIYEREITDKVTGPILDQATEQVSQNPQAFGLDPNLKGEELKENVFALLKKQRSAQWLFDKVEGK
jgi:FKBP-type peptidyl-prolyl cis-trans isomerase (trigger factor)